MVVALVFSSLSGDPRINIFFAGVILEPATETATSPSTTSPSPRYGYHLYKHENKLLLLFLFKLLYLLFSKKIIVMSTRLRPNRVPCPYA